MRQVKQAKTVIPVWLEVPVSPVVLDRLDLKENKDLPAILVYQDLLVRSDQLEV